MNDCLFCKIISKEIPTDFIYEDDLTVAFLDIQPTNPGHILVVPKKHVADFLTAEAAELKACLETLQRLAGKLKSAFQATSFNILQNNGADAGQVIQHLHWHLIPRYANDPLRIYPKERHYEDSVVEYREKIKKALAN